LVLLVEDYPTSQKLGLKHLQNAGYKADLATNGQEAVEAWENKNYDLILMDIQMPIMDGFKATDIIRDLESKISLFNNKDNDSVSRVPIIAMTAHALEGYREKCIDAGMDDYITKPLKKQTLEQMISKWVVNASNKKLENTKSENNLNSNINNTDHPPIDFAEAMKEFDNDKAFLISVIDAFIVDAKNQIGVMVKGLEDNNSEVIRKEAHSIKGGAADLVATRLSKQAYELETIGRSGNLDKAEQLIKTLENEINHLENYIGEQH